MGKFLLVAVPVGALLAIFLYFSLVVSGVIGIPVRCTWEGDAGSCAPITTLRFWELRGVEIELYYAE